MNLIRKDSPLSVNTQTPSEETDRRCNKDEKKFFLDILLGYYNWFPWKWWNSKSCFPLSTSLENIPLFIE